MRSGVDELLEFGFMSVWLAKWSTIMVCQVCLGSGELSGLLGI